MSVSRSRAWYALVVLPLLIGAKEGKGCCKPKDAPDTGPVGPAVTVEQKLQVTGISPSTGVPNTAFPATVSGAGFVDGAGIVFKASGGGAGIRAESVSVSDSNTLAVGVPGLAAGTYDLVVSNGDGASATLRQGLTIRATTKDCAFVRVNFDFDKSALTDTAKSVLDANVPCFQSHGGKISIEGHADERGTTEYNLALGDRRADQVKKYLSGQGVAGSKIETVSFGEERPVASGSGESAWSQNRRADIHAKD